MKRLFNVMLSGLLIVALSACGKQAGTESSVDETGEQYGQTEGVARSMTGIEKIWRIC